MADPVFLCSGNTYEREAISKWLEKNNTDPLENTFLENKNLIPNKAMKSDIIEFLEKNPSLIHETYFPNSLIKELITALEENEIILFSQIVGRDIRLLSTTLTDKKNLLTLACEKASIEILSIVLKKLSVKIFDCLEKDNGLLLFLAVSRRLALEGAKILSEAFAWKEGDIQNLLNIAVKEDDVAVVKIALSLGAIPNFELLNEAYKLKRIEILKALVSAGAPINEKDKRGNDFLLKSIQESYEEFSLFLLTEASNKINPNTQNKAQETALHAAVENHQPCILNALLNHPKIIVNQINGKNETALQTAVRNRNTNLADLLIKNKADINIETKELEAPLAVAYRNKDIAMQKLLIMSGAKMGNLLILAITDRKEGENIQKELIEFLLTEASQLTNPNIELSGKSALMLAVENDQIGTVKLLLNHPDVNIHKKDESGSKALHYAVEVGNQEIIKILMKQGFSIKEKNSDKITPHQIAQEKGFLNIANWMEQKHRSKKIKPFLKPLQVEIQNLKLENQNQKAEIEDLKKLQLFFTPERKQMILLQEKKTQEKQEERRIQEEERKHQKAREEILQRKQQEEENQKNLEFLLKWVTEGHLVEAEKLLEKNKDIVHMTGTVTDLSGRTFKDITVFQYAAWALDIEMWGLILNYLDNKNANEQLMDLETNHQKYSNYGAHYDLSSYAAKLGEYIKSYDSWDWNKRDQHWQKEVGGAQRQFPAWLVYAMREEGENVAWVKQDLKNMKVTRQYDKDHLKWWFEREYNGGKLGNKWASARGRWGCDPTLQTQACAENIHHDIKVGQSIKPTGLEALNSLKSQLSSNNTTDYNFKK